LRGLGEAGKRKENLKMTLWDKFFKGHLPGRELLFNYNFLERKT